MALDCTNICGKIVADQLIDCDSEFVKGIEQQVLIINRCDIESFTVDKTEATHKATAITLKSGSTGYIIQGLSNKSLFYGAHSIVSNDDTPDSFLHTIGLRGYNLTEENLIYIRNLGKGADLVAITLDKAQGDDKYKVYGLQSGLKVGEYSQNTNESSGAFIYTLTSKEPDTESDPPLVWFEADEASTDSKFAGKLAVV